MMPTVANARVTIDVLNAGRETILKAFHPARVITAAASATPGIAQSVALRCAGEADAVDEVMPTSFAYVRTAVGGR